MGLGLCGNGMHHWIIDELELGTRVAMRLDDEAAGWTALDDLSYDAYVAAERASK